MKNNKNILLGHGSGGLLSRSLIEDVFLRAFSNPALAPLNDQAVINMTTKKLAFTTDSYVVNPIFFPGGDIGKLSVCGTINDLAVGGAMPLYLSASFIIEEGLAIEDLERIISSMAEAARDAGVLIVTGDTKVVERGKGDKVFINTAGIGSLDDCVNLSPTFIAPGDTVLVSGHMGDHGIAIMSRRFDMDVPIDSDCAALHTLTSEILKCGQGVKAMRDITRGGLATILNEFARDAGAAIVIDEDSIPIKEAVRGACEILGFDPLYLANEGKIAVVASRGAADNVLAVMKRHPLGRDAAIIGTVKETPAGKLLLSTSTGNLRILDMLSGEQLPRIC